MTMFVCHDPLHCMVARLSPSLFLPLEGKRGGNLRIEQKQGESEVRKKSPGSAKQPLSAIVLRQERSAGCVKAGR
jgi:hypothetical protein